MIRNLYEIKQKIATSKIKGNNENYSRQIGKRSKTEKNNLKKIQVTTLLLG